MSTEKEQASLVGGPSGESVGIETSGRVIKPLLEPLTALVDEAKLRFDADGLHVRAVDAANVSMVDLHAHRQAFETYDLRADDELLVGLNLSALESDLSKARIGVTTDDAVWLDVDGTRVRTRIEREYGGTTLTQTAESLTLDPDSIRQEPDLPDLNTTHETTVSPRAFAAAVNHVGGRGEAHLLVRDGRLVMAGGTEDPTGEYAATATFDSGVSGDDIEATAYSNDYVLDIAESIADAKADDVTIRWAEEFPMIAEFARTDGEDTLYEGHMMLAPRIGDSS